MADRSIGFSVSAVDRSAAVWMKVAAAVDQVSRKVRDLDGAKANVKIDADVKQVQAAISETEKRVADLKRRVEQDTPQLDLDIREAEAKQKKLTADLAALRKQKVSPEVDLKIASAEAQLGRVTAKLDELRGKKVTPEVHAELSKAEADLAAFSAELAALDSKRVTVKVDADTSRARTQIEVLDKSTGAATIRMAALARAMKVPAIGAGIVGALPYLASLGASAIQASGAMWLLPAAALAGGAAAGTLAVGFAHVSDSLGPTGTPAQIKKVNEALAALSPQARATVQVIRGLGPAWSSLRLDVQEKLFKGMAKTVSGLAHTYLPVLKTGLGGIAVELNKSAAGLTGWAAKGRVVGDVAAVFGKVRETMAALAPVATSVASMFLTIGVVGAQFLPGLAAGFASTAASAAAFIARARETGQLAAWIRGGIDTLAQLGRIAGNVGSILGSIFGAAKGAGESFLSVLERVTGKLAAGLDAPAGAAGLTAFFVQVRDVVGIFVQKLATLWPAIQAAGSAFAALLVAAAPLSSTLLSLVTSALVPMLGAIEWLAPVLGPLAVAFFAVSAATSAWAAVMKVAAVAQKAYTVGIAVVSALIHPIATATKVWAAAQWLLNAAMSMNPIGLVVIAIAALVAILVLAWNHSETFRNIVIGAWEAVKSAAVAVFSWLGNFFTTVWGGIVSAATTAWNGVVAFITGIGPAIAAAATAAWQWLVSATSTALDAALAFVAALPGRVAYAIGFLAGVLVRAAIAAWDAFVWASTTGVSNVIAFVATLPARIASFLANLAGTLAVMAVQGWDGFTNGLIAAWAATVTWFVALPGRIQAFFVGAGVWLVQVAATLWAGFTSGLASGWAAVLTWFIALPGRIQAFFVGAGVWLVATGTDLLLGLWNGLIGGFASLMGWIGGLISSFIDGFKAGLGVASPSTIFAEIGSFLIQGLIAGIQAAAAWLWSVITTVASGVVNFFMAGISMLAGMWAAVWNGIVFVFTTVWNTIRNVAVTVWGAITAYFAAGFAYYQAMFAAVWNTISSIFTGVWNFIRNTAVTVWAAISAYFAAAFAYYQAMFAAVWNAISTVFMTVWNFIRNTAVTVWNAIVAYFQAAFAYYQAFFAAVWNAISTVFMTVWNFIRNTAVTVWNAIVAFFTTAFAAFQAFFAFIWNAIWTFFVNTWNNLRNTAVNAWNAIYAFFSNAFAIFTQFFVDTWNNIVGAFDRIWSGIKDIANRVWQGVKDAFVGAINWIIDKINFFAGAINKVAGLLGFNINLHVDRLALGGEVEAVRRALGGTIEAQQVIRRATGGGINAAGGGYLPGRNKPGRDRLPALAGRKPYLLDGGEHITRREATAAVGPAGMAAVNNAHRQPVDIVPRGELQRQALYLAGGAIPLATGGQLAAAASKGVPGTRASNTFREGDSGMHGKNQAADLVGDLPRINRWIADTHGRNTTQLIYTPGINLLNGRPHQYDAPTRADHWDHVHWGMAGSLLGGGIQGVIGGFFQDSYESLLEQAGVLLNPLKNILTPIRDDGKQNYGMRFGAGLGIKILDNLFTKASEQDAANMGGGVMGATSAEAPGIVRIISDVARGRFGGAARQAAVVGTATGLVESGLRNLAGGDRDSVGVFQQRPSQGWGTVAQCRNVSFAAGSFFSRFPRNWQSMEPGALAQSVQRSAFPGKYATRMGEARGLVDRHGAFDSGGVGRGTGVMFKDVITPERVLSGRQTAAFEELVAGLTSGRPQRRVGGGAVLEQIAATQSTRRTPALTGPGGDGIAVNIGTLSTPPGTTAGEMAGVLRREMRVAKHGGRYRR